MSKYYIKDHVTDEMLEAVGFVKNEESIIDIWFDRDCLKNKGEYVAKDVLIVSTKHSDKRKERLFQFNYPHCRRSDDVKNYIQDLIQLGYVEVRE